MAAHRQQARRVAVATEWCGADAEHDQPQKSLIIMISNLQKHLTDIYQVDPGFEVTDFLITDPTLARLLGDGSLVPNTDESVLLSQDEEGLALSVYLEEEMVARLTRDNPMDELRADQLDDLCKVIEGISHFNYIVWRAQQD